MKISLHYQCILSYIAIYAIHCMKSKNKLQFRKIDKENYLIQIHCIIYF